VRPSYDLLRGACFVALAATAGCAGGTTVGPAPFAPATATPGHDGGSALPTNSPAPGQSTAPTASPAPGASVTPSAPTPTPSASHGATPSPSPTPTSTATSVATNPIKHIVIVIQENRSFDNLFRGFSEPSGAVADYANYGYDKNGNQIALQPILLESIYDPGHSHGDFVADYDGGKNDGFKANNSGTNSSTANNGYAYIEQQEIQPYWDMAAQGALAQRFFHGMTGPTWPSHLMWAAGSTTWDGNPNDRVDGNPGTSLGWGCEDGNASDTTSALAPNGTETAGPFPCFTGVTTIADLLQNAHHSCATIRGRSKPPARAETRAETRRRRPAAT